MTNLSDDSAIHQEPLSYKDSYFPCVKRAYLKYALYYNGNGASVRRSNAKYAN